MTLENLGIPLSLFFVEFLDAHVQGSIQEFQCLEIQEFPKEEFKKFPKRETGPRAYFELLSREFWIL